MDKNLIIGDLLTGCFQDMKLNHGPTVKIALGAQIYDFLERKNTLIFDICKFLNYFFYFYENICSR